MVDFETLKRKLYFSYHRDGILDLVVGLTMLGFGINMNTESSAFIVLSWIGLILYGPLKSTITIPRMGYVQFDDARTRRSQLLALLGIGIGTLILFVSFSLIMRGDNVSAEFDTWFREYYLLILGGIPAVALAITAVQTGVYRLLGHSLLILVVIFAGIRLNISESFYVMGLGGVISLIGLWLLIRFMRQYPVQKEGDYDFH
jgi:hypothetical protein